jgi:hypothetical protein
MSLIEKPGQQFGAFDDGNVLIPRRTNIGDRILHRGGDDERIDTVHAGAVLREQPDPLLFQPGELFARTALVARPVGTGDGTSHRFQNKRERQHSVVYA